MPVARGALASVRAASARAVRAARRSSSRRLLVIVRIERCEYDGTLRTMSSALPRLTTTQHLILTTIAWRGPCTPYELKDYFQRVVRHLVEVPHTLLYTEPPKLAEL